MGVQRFERRVETLDSCVPAERRRIVPRLLSLRHRERPIQKVSEVGQELGRRSGLFRGVKFGEVGWCAPHRFGAAIGQGRKGVAE